MYNLLCKASVEIGKKFLSPSMAGYLLKTSNISIIKTVSSKVLLDQRLVSSGASKLTSEALGIIAKIVTKI